MNPQTLDMLRRMGKGIIAEWEKHRGFIVPAPIIRSPDATLSISEFKAAERALALDLAFAALREMVECFHDGVRRICEVSCPFLNSGSGRCNLALDMIPGWPGTDCPAAKAKEAEPWTDFWPPSTPCCCPTVDSAKRGRLCPQCGGVIGSAGAKEADDGN